MSQLRPRRGAPRSRQRGRAARAADPRAGAPARRVHGRAEQGRRGLAHALHPRRADARRLGRRADAFTRGTSEDRLGAAQEARAVRRRAPDRERTPPRIPPAHVSVNVGDEFGPYKIESLLGRGGMGTVYLATHARLERRVALKVIAPDLADDPDFRARFLRESRLAASLDHPHVIPIYDADEIDGTPYLAMRYVDGPSLHEVIRESGALSRGETLRIAEQIGGALDAAHQADLIHRDLKPANILLAEAGRHAYLCDFGLAKRTSSRGMTHAGSFLGTVDYCSPEQIRGEPLDGRADVYSLGCVVYHCLSGEPPYARDSEVAVLQAHLNDPPPSLSPDLDGVFAGAMAKDREDRYPTGAALTSDLREAIAGGAPATVRAEALPATREH